MNTTGSIINDRSSWTTIAQIFVPAGVGLTVASSSGSTWWGLLAWAVAVPVVWLLAAAYGWLWSLTPRARRERAELEALVAAVRREAAETRRGARASPPAR